MAKSKIKTIKAFRGRRRRVYNRSIAKELIRKEGEAMATQTDESSCRPSCSASINKMQLHGFDFETCTELLQDAMTNKVERESDIDCFFITQKSALSNLLKLLCCPNCKQNGIIVKIDQQKGMGLSVYCSLYCAPCSETISEGFLSDRIGGTATKNAPFEVNVRSVLAFMGIGCGFSAMTDWSSIMNFPKVGNKSSYQKTKLKVMQGSLETCEKIMSQSAIVVHQKYAEIGVLPDSDGILDISVSFDGSWQRRGHSSHNGIATVIDLLTGLPLDFECLSNFCHKCAISPKESDPEFSDWQNNHKPNCNKNFHGTSNAMEQECAKRMFQRSVEKYNLRYTTVLSDGDSKSYDAVVAEKVYGDKTEIKKEECINHVSKRMGSALRKLKDDRKTSGQSISGKGKLTDALVKKIQNYYGRAIREHSDDTLQMKKSIFAILFHLSSSDQHPKHVHCPEGDKSWCFWQRALSKKEDPGSHNDHETLPAVVAKQLVPVFNRLTDQRLLQRCARGKTQNSNEALHNLIWKLCPKSKYVGRQTVGNSVCMAICQFSAGATFRETICKVMGMEPGFYLEKGSMEKDIKRVKKAEKASRKEAKTRRKQLKYSKVATQRKCTKAEGKTYEAGAFS